MQVVILAGGLGTRLWPLTRTGPKPMVLVAGVPYLEHQVRLLQKQSIEDIVMLTGYLGEQIENYFGDGGRWGMSIKYSRELQPLGTAGALRQAETLLAQTFVLIYGDSYLPVRYADCHDRLLDTGALCSVAAYDNESGDTMVKSNIDLDSSGYVTVYEKDSDRHLRYVEAGVLAMRKECIGLIPPAGAVSLEKEIFPQLIANKQLVAWLTRQRFYDIGTPERLRVITDFLSHDHYSNAVSN
jgi:mannose-1-phosphate guanylyltransferase